MRLRNTRTKQYNVPTKAPKPALNFLIAIATISLFSLISFFSANLTYATAEEITPDQWGVDTYLAKLDFRYKQIKSVQIVRLSLNPDFTYTDGDELAKTIYYHYVFKLGFNEPIINTIITPDQEVYQLTRSLDSQVAHTNANGSLVIGLLTTTDDLTDYQTALSDYLVSVCSYYSVSAENISANDFTLSAGETPSITFLSTADADFKMVVDTTKAAISGQIVPEPSVVSLDTDEEGISVSINPGEEDTIEIPFTNDGIVPIYGGDSSSVLMKSSAIKQSVFYSSTWATPLIGGKITEERVGPLETGTMTLTLKAPLLPKDHIETFTLVTSTGSPLSETTVTVTVTTNDIGQKVLQIQDTGTGYLNVRSSPSAYGSIIDTVAISNIYLFDQLENGYYHILNGDKPGWVSARYIKVLEN